MTRLRMIVNIFRGRPVMYRITLRPQPKHPTCSRCAFDRTLDT